MSKRNRGYCKMIVSASHQFSVKYDLKNACDCVSPEEDCTYGTQTKFENHEHKITLDKKED